jgi:hypothetical protein
MEDRKDKQDAQRILLVKESIANAEKNLQTAKSILAQLESKYTLQKKTYGVAEGGKVIEGSFDGQLMIGTDGRQYPVPANYASKSKLVEGDMLKLVITDDGNFIYKQIGPFKRKRLIGMLKESPEEGGYIVEAEDKNYKVLLAAVTYHHAGPGDEIAVVVADNDEAKWAAIENVTRKGTGEEVDYQAPPVGLSSGEADDQELNANQDLKEPEPDITEPKSRKKSKKREEKTDSEEVDEKALKEVQDDKKDDTDEIDEELTPDLLEMEKELKKQVAPKS